MTCSPFLGQEKLEFSSVLAHDAATAGETFVSDIRGLLPIVLCGPTVSTPRLHFLPGVLTAHEPVRVQTFRPELAIERIVRRLAKPGEVEHDPAGSQLATASFRLERGRRSRYERPISILRMSALARRSMRWAISANGGSGS